MSWRLLAEVRDRDFAPVVEHCRALRTAGGQAAPIPFNAAHGKLLMLLLAEWVNDEGAAVYPRSKAAFASACGLSERQVQRLFAGLIEAGLVKIDRRENARAKTPRLYRIDIGALIDLPLNEVARADLKSRIFGPALDWLAEQSGRPKVKLRSMVGRWCRDHGDGRVLEALTDASRNGAVEPVAWIERVLKGGRDGKRVGQGRLTAGQSAVAGLLGTDIG